MTMFGAWQLSDVSDIRADRLYTKRVGIWVFVASRNCRPDRNRSLGGQLLVSLRPKRAYAIVYRCATRE